MTTPTQRFPVTVYFETHPRLNRGGYCEINMEGETPKKVASRVHDLFKSSGYEYVKVRTNGPLKYEEWSRKDIENTLNSKQ